MNVLEKLLLRGGVNGEIIRLFRSNKKRKRER